MRPLIFLDIDDVIATDPDYFGTTVIAALEADAYSISQEFCQRVFSTQAITNLALLNMRFSPQYVISSSWANYLTKSQITYVFEKASLRFVSMNFHRHWKTPKSQISGRLIEIELWISTHLKSSSPFLIIDDYDSGWNLVGSVFDKNKQLILCEQHVGFDKSKLAIATERLVGQIDNENGTHTQKKLTKLQSKREFTSKFPPLIDDKTKEHQ